MLDKNYAKWIKWLEYDGSSAFLLSKFVAKRDVLFLSHFLLKKVQHDILQIRINVEIGMQQA